MAIKVGGTSVISDSRVLENVTGLKTINSTSILGSGDIDTSPSTTYGAVGTYVFAYRSTAGTTEGSTYSGSQLHPASVVNGDTTTVPSDSTSTLGAVTRGSDTLSGTWRAMGRNQVTSRYGVTLYVRIS